MFIRSLVLFLAWLPVMAIAQNAAPTPSQALSAALPGICAGRPSASLQARCAEILASSSANAFQIAAGGQGFDQIPGQARLANRDGAASAVPPVPEAENEASNWQVFATTESGELMRDMSPIEAGFDARVRSGLLGVAWQPRPQWSGFAAWSSKGEALDYTGSTSRADARSDGLLIQIDHSLTPRWSWSAYAGVLDGELDLQRRIEYTLPTGATNRAFSADARGRPDTRQRIDGAALRFTQDAGAWSHTLEARLDRSRTTIDAFAEVGGDGLAIALPRRDLRTRRAGLSAALSRAISVPHGVLLPQLRVGLTREFDDPSRTLTVRLVDDANRTPIRFATQEPDAWWGDAALGAVWVMPNGASAFVEWRQRFAHTFLDERIIAVGIRVER